MRPPLGAALLVLAFAAGAQPSAPGPLLTWDVRHALMRPGNVPRVQVFADGRVTVTRSRGRLDAGTFDYAVSPAALADLEALALEAVGARAAAGTGSGRGAGSGNVADANLVPAGSVVVGGGAGTREIVADPALTVFEYFPRESSADASTASVAPGVPGAEGGGAGPLPDGEPVVIAGYMDAPADDGSGVPMARLQDALQAFFTRPLEGAR